MARSSKVYASLQQVSRRFSQGTEGEDGPTSNSALSRRSSQTAGGFVVMPQSQNNAGAERTRAASPRPQMTIPDHRRATQDAEEGTAEQPTHVANLSPQTTTPAATQSTSTPAAPRSATVSVADNIGLQSPTQSFEKKATDKQGVFITLEALLAIIVAWLVSLIGIGLIGYWLASDQPTAGHENYLPPQNHPDQQVTQLTNNNQLHVASQSQIDSTHQGDFVVVLSSVGGSSDLNTARQKFLADAASYNDMAQQRNAPAYFCHPPTPRWRRWIAIRVWW